MIASGGWFKAEGYIQSVLDDDFPVCKCMKGVISRHLADIKKSPGPDFPYYFDVDRASTMVDTFELLLCHSKGEFAGLPFVLEPWQAFGIGSLYGWLRIDNQARRFSELWWTMARKNGKSAIASGLAILLASIDVNPVTKTAEPVAEIILAATKREQALQVLMSEVERMRLRSPVIKAMSTTAYRQVRFTHNEGQIHAVGSDKPFDGLNGSGNIADELHAWGEHQRPFWNTLTTGSGSRVQPVTAVFTTAGSDRSYLWLEQYRRASGVALGKFADDNLLPLIYELDPEDDALDPANWIKANPNLGVSVKESYLHTQANKARTGSSALNQFTRYHGNRLVTAIDQAISMEDWDNAQGQLSDWEEADGIGCGIDLGGRDDLAAFALAARFDTGEQDDEGNPVDRYEIQAWAYLSTATERDLDKQPWADWISEERIRLRRFPITAMKHDILAELEIHRVDTTAYDPSGGQQFAEEIEAEGYPIASMAQTFRHFNEPIGHLQELLSDGRLTHSGCPFLRWAVGNAKTVTDRQCRVMYDKSASEGKIDPLVAFTMALARAAKAPRIASGPLFMS
jgi:phage terminase large subunit-like protein